MCVGDVVGTVVVGDMLGACDGTVLGNAVGAAVDEQRVASLGTATYPSRRSDTRWLRDVSGFGVCTSHP